MNIDNKLVKAIVDGLQDKMDKNQSQMVNLCPIPQ